jgi:proline dehydrogenase
MEVLMRNLFQSIAKSRSANQLAKRYGLRFGAARFVAGETIKQSIEVVRKLNQSGRVVTLDHLGEFITSVEEAVEST